MENIPNQQQGNPNQAQPQNQVIPSQTTVTPETPVVSKAQISPRKNSKIVIAVIIFFLILVIITILYFILNKGNTPEEKTSAVLIPTTQPTRTPSGKYEGISTIRLNDLSGKGYSATAHRSISQDYVFRSVHANLPDPSDQYFYQVWIGNNQDGFTPIGILTKDSLGAYSLIQGFNLKLTNLSDSFSFSDLKNTFIVSLENTNDDSMEEKILQGTFTE